MVKKIEHKGKIYYQCEICFMYYETFDWAEKCEKSCREKKCCDTVVMQHAVELDIKEDKNGGCDC